MSPLAVALPAMMLLQAIVALGAFAPSVLAPQAGLTLADLGLLNTALFATGALSSAFAGRVVGRFGDLGTARLCVLAIALAMLAAAPGGGALWLAAIVAGLAFGPETPASTALLGRLTPPAQRTLVFSVRQTGNQIGAMTGSLALPALWLLHPAAPFVAIAVAAVAAAAWFGRLAARLPVAPAAAATADTGRSGPARGSVRAILAAPHLRALAAAVLCYTALQMSVNTFLMSHAVHRLAFEVAEAGLLVAGVQASGLVGRLGWGWLAQRTGQPARLLWLLGPAMGAATGFLVLAGAEAGRPAQVVAALALGLTASGWNGVFVAEAARLAGPGNGATLTGGLLFFGYAGLAATPLGFAGVASGIGSGGAFALLGLLCAAAGCWLGWNGRPSPVAGSR